MLARIRNWKEDVDLEDQELLQYISDLNEEKALAEVRWRVQEGRDPFGILKICQAGVRLVGERYEDGEYFISGLIMASVILRLSMDIIRPELEKKILAENFGTVVIGTVQGDIHDIGKNIVSTLLSCHGFQVVDLGIDIHPEKFIEAAKLHRPKILGLSCLLTTAQESMRDTITAIDEAGLRKELPIMIGGCAVNEDFCRFSGADFWTNDAIEGVTWCLRTCGLFTD